MHLAHLRLKDFRNYQWLDIDLTPGFHLLLGDNAQGKTNILEAIYLMSTLRSFRGVGNAQLIREGQSAFFIGSKIVSAGQRDLRMYWSPRVRKLSLDNEPVRRLTDFLGVVRTVVFCTEDLQLIKGSSRNRRRYLDLLLTQTFPGYLSLLQRYAQAIKSRNALLKNPGAPETLEGFTREVVAAGTDITRLRAELLPKITPLIQSAHRRIAPAGEELSLVYQPSVRTDFAVQLAQVRERERVYRNTIIGPHRDEVLLEINGRLAADFGSEGQKRSLAIALKIAQAEYITQLHGVAPILLIDDIMGELDLKRRSALLPLLERTHQARGQVFMTATEENWPRELGQSAARWEIKAGTMLPMAQPSS